jgi:hypothetical protein
MASDHDEIPHDGEDDNDEDQEEDESGGLAIGPEGHAASSGSL